MGEISGSGLLFMFPAIHSHPEGGHKREMKPGTVGRLVNSIEIQVSFYTLFCKI